MNWSATTSGSRVRLMRNLTSGTIMAMTSAAARTRRITLPTVSFFLGFFGFCRGLGGCCRLRGRLLPGLGIGIEIDATIRVDAGLALM